MPLQEGIYDKFLAGRMWVNTYHELPAHAPFGGYKKSGLGRECHKAMVEAYTETKNILVSLSEAAGEHYSLN